VTGGPVTAAERLRALPAVDRLAAHVVAARPGTTQAEAVSVAREVVAARRRELLEGAGDDADLLARCVDRLRGSLRPVLNATGVLVHTNLGRAPLPDAAADALARAARGYVNLELDLESGRRGGRDEHVGGLLRELTGAQDALVVNNGAAAVLLAAAALAGPDGGIAVSRGQLVEIGGGFRIPDVVRQAGARLVEVGTTNRTRLEDYAAAVGSGEADVLLRVHQSNFRTVGFVQDVGVGELCTLGVPVIDDVGSGAFASLPQLADEPPVPASVAAGAAVVCFSGDKLLGGPQAGILVGTAEAVGACRRHPLARALRAGRLPVAALEATLALYRDPERARREIPVLAMLDAAPEDLARRAEALAGATGGGVVASAGRVGGGALPLLDLPGPAVALPDDPQPLARELRLGDPAVLGRIADGRLLLDPRTLRDEDVEVVAAMTAAARRRLGGAAAG